MVDPEVVRRRVLARLHGSDPDWDEDDLPPLPGERESGYRAETERHDAVGVASDGAGTVAGVAPRSGARRGAQRVAFGRRVPEPGASSGNRRAGRENRPPRQSQPLRASPSAESSGASVHYRDVPPGMRGDPRGPDRAARPATSSSQRGQSLSLLKREHAARQSPAHRRDPDAPLAAEAESVHRPRHFQNSHTQVYNRLLAESAARRARLQRPRDDEGGADHGADHGADDDEWRVRRDEPHAPPPHPRRVGAEASSKNTTEDEGGGYWGATEPEEGGNTDAAYDVPSPTQLLVRGGGGARRSRRRGAGADARAVHVVPDPPANDVYSPDGGLDDDAGDAMSTGEEDEPGSDAFDETDSDTGIDAAVGDDIGTLPRTVDVLGALRGDNLELRDKLREATEMLSRVSEERAAATRQRTLLQRQLKEATATRERLREREAAAERARREAAEAAASAEARAASAEKKLEKLANAKKAALEAESRTVRAESRISALEMELASMRERVERAEEERDEAKAESKAMAVWRIEEDEKARSGDHAALAAAAEEAELILAPFAGEDADTDIDAILSPQAKSGPGRRDEDEIRSTHPLAAIAARAAANMERRESRLSSLLSALTGEMAASKRAEKEISQLRKRVAESETAAAAAIGALERERLNASTRGFSSTRGGDVGGAGVAAPATPSARDVASMAVGLASSAKSRVRDAEEELRAANARIEALGRENASLESRLERSERLRAGLRLAADASEAMTEQLGELETANGKLRDECMATSRVALHSHRRWRMARMDRWAEGKARGMSSFGADLRDAKAAVFFCFKFWRELSKGDAPERGPSAAASRRSSVEEEKGAEDGFTFAPPSPRGEDAFTPPAAGGGPTPFKDLNPFANK